MTRFAAHARQIPEAARETFWTAPDGWRLRRFDWAAEGTTRGRLLFQGGRGDIYEKYLESFAHWHARGWSITSLDWRGQGGSGRLAGPHVGHIDRFETYLADFAAFWRAWRGEGAGSVAVIGHSMGGHLLLRGAVEGLIDPAALVLVAPMLGLRSPLGPGFGGRLARFLAARGDPARAAWRTNERPGSLATRQKLLTHDRRRYEDEQWWHRTRPETRLGPPSWTWLAEAFGSTASLAADARLRGLAAPVLMLLAERDGLVDASAAVALARALPNVEVVRFGRESAHEILREADPVRDRALAAIDAFLDERAA